MRSGRIAKVQDNVQFVDNALTGRISCEDGLSFNNLYPVSPKGTTATRHVHGELCGQGWKPNLPFLLTTETAIDGELGLTWLVGTATDLECLLGYKVFGEANFVVMLTFLGL